MMIQRLQQAYFFTLECYFLYLLVFLFYLRLGEIPSIIAIFAIISGGNLTLFFLVKRKLVNNSIIFLISTLLGVVAYFLGFSIISAILCGGFLYIRIGAFIKDSSMWTEERSHFAILFYCSSVVIFLIGWVFRYPYMNVLIFMVIVFTLLYSVGRFLQQMNAHNRIGDFFGLASVLSIIVFLTGIGTLLLPMVKFVFFKVFSVLILIGTIIARPLFSLFEEIILNVKPKQQPLNLKGKYEAMPPDGRTHPIETISPWIWLAVFVVLLVIIWFIVKKKSKKVDPNLKEKLDIHLEHTPLFVKSGKKRRFFREPAPNEYIRKLIYQLDSYADKYHLGRYHYETIREWFERVGFQKNEELFLAYESVRYGNVNIQKSEASHLEEVILNIKQDIKERNKK
jgi:hypothetical protein